MKNKFLQNLTKIEFVVTYACTGQSKHCSEGDHPLCGNHIDPSVAASWVKKITSQYDIQTVMTFGGEPLLYPDTVYAVMSAARDADVPKRQIITNGYFTKDRLRIREICLRLRESGVNDVLLSVDAFHQETIPLSIVQQFAEEMLMQHVSVRLQPSFLVSAADDNIYNRKTREILDAFQKMGLAENDGNVIFPEGNARKYLAEYFEDAIPQNPYEENPFDVRCVSFEPDGGVLNKNAYETDILEILTKYDPLGE